MSPTITAARRVCDDHPKADTRSYQLRCDVCQRFLKDAPAMNSARRTKKKGKA